MSRSKKIGAKLACWLFGHPRWDFGRLLCNPSLPCPGRAWARCTRCGTTEHRKFPLPGPCGACRACSLNPRARPTGTTFEEAEGLLDAMWRHVVLDARGIDPEAMPTGIKRLVLEETGWLPREAEEAAAFLDRLSPAGHPTRSEVDAALDSIVRTTQDQDEPR